MIQATGITINFKSLLCKKGLLPYVAVLFYVRVRRMVAAFGSRRIFPTSPWQVQTSSFFTAAESIDSLIGLLLRPVIQPCPVRSAAMSRMDKYAFSRGANLDNKR